MKTKQSAARLGFVVPLVLAAIAGLAAYYWRDISDYARYISYTPPAHIQELADRAMLHDKGEYYFYLSEPVLEGTQIFNQYCGRREEKSAILGCYDGTRIYVYDVDDERLQGIEEVTAAHEMLHAAWDRLSMRERTRLEPLLESAYQELRTEELTERMEYYDRNEPGEHYNELHSILATEFTDLPAELEQYFKQYFSDRRAVVAIHDSYQRQFTERQARIDQLYQRLTVMVEQINSATQQYNAASAQLNNDIQEFNRQAEAGKYSSESAFYQDRNQLVSRAETLDAERSRIEAVIADFEAIKREYEQLADETQDLQRSIDSSLAPTPAV